MALWRVATLLLILLNFQMIWASDRPEWLHEVTEKYETEEQKEELLKARKQVVDNIQQAESKQGRMLDTFLVVDAEMCALACGLKMECHFIDVTENSSDDGFTCTLYSELGETSLVTSEGDCQDKDNIKETLNKDAYDDSFTEKLDRNFA